MILGLAVFVQFVDLFVSIFEILLIVRVVSSYVARPDGRFYNGLVNITEPVLAPVRGLLPKMPGLDMAPLVVFFLLQLGQYAVHALVIKIIGG